MLPITTTLCPIWLNWHECTRWYAKLPYQTPSDTWLVCWKSTQITKTHINVLNCHIIRQMTHMWHTTHMPKQHNNFYSVHRLSTGYTYWGLDSWDPGNHWRVSKSCTGNPARDLGRTLWGKFEERIFKCWKTDSSKYITWLITVWKTVVVTVVVIIVHQPLSVLMH